MGNHGNEVTFHIVDLFAFGDIREGDDRAHQNSGSFHVMGLVINGENRAVGALVENLIDDVAAFAFFEGFEDGAVFERVGAAVGFFRVSQVMHVFAQHIR